MRTNHAPWNGSTEAAMSGSPDAVDLAAAARTWGPARSRLVTWRDPSVVASGTRQRSGLDALRAVRDGALPSWPMQRLLQIDLVTLERGRVEVRCAVDESVYSPLGAVHGGLVCTLLDTVAGCAVLSTLPPGVGFTSIELKVSFLRPVVLVSGPLTAIGTVVKAGRRIAFAEGGGGRRCRPGRGNGLQFLVGPPAAAGGRPDGRGWDHDGDRARPAVRGPDAADRPPDRPRSGTPGPG